MEQAQSETTSVALETIITNAVKMPGVKVNRSKFLAEIFADDDSNLQAIIDMGPISAGVSHERIEKAATKLIFFRTSQSSVASFVAGIPGGFAIAGDNSSGCGTVFWHGSAPCAGIVLLIWRVRSVDRRSA